MVRKFTEDTLIIASHNAGKVKEISALLTPFGVEVKSAGALELPEPEETEDSFAGNARLKAEAAAKAAGLPALADDSGLCVDALDGAPGIYSARWGGPDRDFYVAMENVERAVKAARASNPALTDRAHFTCALALAWPDGHTETFEGHVHGRIAFPPKGSHGFGYDPIFIAEGQDLTFGEMAPAKKHAMSHRADAFGQLVEACFAR